MAKYNGYILDVFHSYQPIFALAGGAYIAGMLVIHSLSPMLQRVPEENVTAPRAG
jgi:ACS family hexuronate transporter-like MFS transporter